MEQLPALSNYTLYGECIGVSKFDEIAELAMDDLRIVSIELVGGKPKVEWERGHPAMDGTPVPSFFNGQDARCPSKPPRWRLSMRERSRLPRAWLVRRQGK